MALSNDCLRQRDYENALTQRRLALGVLGAVGLHVGLLPWLSWSPLQLAELDEPDRIQLVVTPEAPEPITETTLEEEAAAAPEPPPPVPTELAETPNTALTLDESPTVAEPEIETPSEPETEISAEEPETETPTPDAETEEEPAGPVEAEGEFSDALSRLLTGVGSDLNAESVPTGNGEEDEVPEEAGGGGSSGTETAAASGSGGGGGGSVSCSSCSRPSYPASALDAGIEGQPVVVAEFDASGNVIGVTLVQSSGNAALDQAALSSVRNWRFNTGGQAGSVPVEIPFVIDGSERHEEAQRQGDRDSVDLPSEGETAAEESPDSASVESPSEEDDATPADSTSPAAEEDTDEPEEATPETEDEAADPAAAPETPENSEPSEPETAPEPEAPPEPEAAPPAAEEAPPPAPEPPPEPEAPPPAPVEPAPQPEPVVPEPAAEEPAAGDSE